MPSDDFKRILSQTDNWADWHKKAFEDQTGLKLQEMENKYLIADKHQNRLMTITEAIQHCREKEDCTLCGQEHRQLREWLEELLFLRKLLYADRLNK